MGRLHTYILVFATLCTLCPLGASALEAEALEPAAFKLNTQKLIRRRLALPRAHFLIGPLQTAQLTHSKKVWLKHFDRVRPAHRFRITSTLPFEQYDLWLDAQNGRTLRIRPASKHFRVPAHAFNYAPVPHTPLTDQLEPVFIENLLSDTPGASLIGKYFSTANCCRYVKCPTAGLVCDPSQWVCADPADPSALPSTKSFTLKGSALRLDVANPVPNTIYVTSSTCARLPSARIALNDLGQPAFLSSPIDDETSSSESESFSEIQAYHSASTYFNYLRKLVGDDSFCFRSQAMSCNPDASRPFRIFVNQLLPDLSIGPEGTNNPDSFVSQLSAGRGVKQNPVVLSQMSRITNAAFITGSDLDANDSNLSMDDIIGDFVKPYDYLIFFQGVRDLVYDGDVVFHEMTHAFTTTLAPQLGHDGLNEKGLYVDPGSMDEGYADYFAASFTNSSAIGEYVADGMDGKQSLRNVNNLRVCPQDIVGEIHEDSTLWSGALWDIRKFVTSKLGAERVLELDRLFLTALTNSSEEESFSDQAQRILDLLSASPVFSAAFSTAEDAFFARGIRGCDRIYSLNDVMDETTVVSNPKTALYLMSPDNFGLSNFSPPPLQLKITIPRGVRQFRLRYDQALRRDSLVNAGLPEKSHSSPNPIRFAVSQAHPIEWSYENQKAIPFSNQQQVDIDNDASRPIFKDGSWYFEASADGDSCHARDVYVSPITSDYDYLLRGLRVEFGPSSDCESPADLNPPGCGCTATQTQSTSILDSPLLSLLACLFIGLVLSRIARTNAKSQRRQLPSSQL